MARTIAKETKKGRPKKAKMERANPCHGKKLFHPWPHLQANREL